MMRPLLLCSLMICSGQAFMPAPLLSSKLASPMSVSSRAAALDMAASTSEPGNDNKRRSANPAWLQDAEPRPNTAT
eukprot:11540-Heterococcus_DN1.PRE.3